MWIEIDDVPLPEEDLNLVQRVSAARERKFKSKCGSYTVALFNTAGMLLQVESGNEFCKKNCLLCFKKRELVHTLIASGR